MTQTKPGGHLHAIDIVRLLTVAGVIAVHCTSLTMSTLSDADGALVIWLHVTREVFLFLTAFVLGYSYRHRPLEKWSFWKRRYPVVAAPYAVWSLIYVLTGGSLNNFWDVTGRYLLDLGDGGAHFHLYFLLLTMQLYAIYPALRQLLIKAHRYHLHILIGSLIFELWFESAIHYEWKIPVLNIWFSHPGSWLPSYAFFVIAGIIAAIYFEPFTEWVRAHTRLIAAGTALAFGLGMVSYVIDITVIGWAPVKASEVFQPMVVIESIFAMVGQYAFGLWITERMSKHRLKQMELVSDVSFGVYLAHPLLVGGILDVAATIGLSAWVGHWPSGLLEVVVIFLLVPFVYSVTFAGINLLLKTRLSVWFTGRKYRPRTNLSVVR